MVCVVVKKDMKTGDDNSSVYVCALQYLLILHALKRLFYMTVCLDRQEHYRKTATEDRKREYLNARRWVLYIFTLLT